MDKRNIYHYPKMTSIEKIREQAFEISKKEPVTIHYHPYDDAGCSKGETLRANLGTYADLPLHERYVDGEMQKPVPVRLETGEIVGSAQFYNDGSNIMAEIAIDDKIVIDNLSCGITGVFSIGPVSIKE